MRYWSAWPRGKRAHHGIWWVEQCPVPQTNSKVYPSSNSNHQTTNASDMSVIIVKKRVELLSKWPSPIVEHARAFGQLKKETEPTLYGQVKNVILYFTNIFASMFRRIKKSPILHCLYVKRNLVTRIRRSEFQRQSSV